MPPALITPILVSAAVGAVAAAVSGGNILKGALLGAVGGAIGATFLGAGAGASSGAATAGGGAGELAGSALGAATEPVTSLATAGSGAAEGAFSGFVGEAPWTATAGSQPLDFASGVTAPSGVAAPANTGLSQSVNTSTLGASTPAEIGVQAPQTIYQGGADSGIFNAAKDSQLANAELGLSADTSLVSPAVPAGQPSAIESMWERVFGKDGYLDKPGTRGLVGAGLQGMAQGMNTQKLLEARREQEERARQNARFGTQTSRFAPVGLISNAKTPYSG